MSNTFSQVHVVPLAILAHLENGILGRTECRDKILLPTGKKCYAKFQNVVSGFCIAENEKNTSFWVVFQVYK